MDQYTVTYKQQIIELLPPDKRYKNFIAFLNDCMISTLTYLRDAVLGDYRNGSVVGAWVSGSYARGVKVNYKKAIFVSLVDNNTATPTDPNFWYLQQQFFIGLVERLAYNGNNLVLTYALNNWFGTTFRQPGTGTSDIYITTNPIESDLFQVGLSEVESSEISYEGSTEAIGYTDAPIGEQFNATFHIPNTLVTSLGSAAVALITSYINMYIYAGITYELVYY